MISTNSQNAHAVFATFFHLPRRGKQSRKKCHYNKDERKKNCSRSNSASTKNHHLEFGFPFHLAANFFLSSLKRKKRNRTHEHKLWGIKKHARLPRWRWDRFFNGNINVGFRYGWRKKSGFQQNSCPSTTILASSSMEKHVLGSLRNKEFLICWM